MTTHHPERPATPALLPPIPMVGAWAGLYLVIIALLGHQWFLAPANAIPMGAQIPGPIHLHADPLFFVWWIDWLWQHPTQIISTHAPLDAFFYPFGGEVSLLRASLLQSLIVLALAPLGDPHKAYTVTWVLSYLLTALSTALLAYRIAPSSHGAFLAGLLVILSPHFVFHNLQHSYKYLAFFCYPLFTLFLYDFLETGRWPSYLSTFLFAALMIVSDWYNVLYGTLTGALLGGYFLVLATSRTLPRLALLTALLPPLAGLLLWVLLPMMGGAEEEALRSGLHEHASYSLDLATLFLPHSYHYLWHGLAWPKLENLSGNLFEKTAFLGVLFPFLLLALFWRARQVRAGYPWLIMAGLFFLLALGPFVQAFGHNLLPGPEYLFAQLPGFSGARAPGRYLLPALVALSVALALALANTPIRHRWIAAVAILAILEIAPPTTPFLYPGSEAITAIAQTKTPGTVINLPYGASPARFAYEQLHHRHPTVGGYEVRVSRYFQHHPNIAGHSWLRTPETGSPPPLLLSSLDMLFQVRFIVLHKDLLPNWRTVAQNFASRHDPDISHIQAESIYEDSRHLVFHLRPTALSATSQNTTNPVPWEIEPGAPATGIYFSGLGWGKSEHSPNEGAFQWGIGSHQQAVIARPPEARSITLRLMSFAAMIAGMHTNDASKPAQQNIPMTIEICGQNHRLSAPDHWQELTFPCAGDSPIVTLNIISPTAQPKAHLPDSQDSRPLSIALSSIRWYRTP